VADNLFAAADRQVSNVAHDAAPAKEEVDDESFGRENVAGNVSAARTLSAVCWSPIRFSMNLRSRSDNFVQSSPR
jgi:hypothetical protein